MYYTFKLQSRLFVIIVLFYLPSLASPAPSLNLSALTKESSLIVVGKIVSVQDVGEGVLSRPGGAIPVLNKIGKIQVNRTLKGQAPESMMTFEFVQTIVWYGIADVRTEQVGMFFLKPNAKNGFTVTNLYFPFIVAAMAPPPKTAGSDFERVITEVTNVLALPQTTWVDKFNAVEVLEYIEAPGVSESLRMAAKSGNQRVKLRSIIALLYRNDISVLGVVEKMLSQPQSGRDQDFINMARSLRGMKDPRVVPALARLLKSPHVEVRCSSALALRRTRSDAAINPFAKALYDSDRDVRYHAVMGLAEITKQYPWGPAMDIYYSNERYYLDYWRD